MNPSMFFTAVKIESVKVRKVVKRRGNTSLGESCI